MLDRELFIGHRQKTAWIPILFSKLNSVRTRELIPQLTMPKREEKFQKAIELFQDLIKIEKDAEMKKAREWSLEYFKAHAKGAKERREFLIDEGVFNDKDFLTLPKRVVPQMEILNLKAANYKGELQKRVKEMNELMFHEYFGVKNLLSFPGFSDIMAFLFKLLPPFISRFLPAPTLKLSLLLRDYVFKILEEAKKIEGPPLIGIIGPGKGEELVPLIRNGLSVMCIDAHQSETMVNLFKGTFADAREPMPVVTFIGEGKTVDVSSLKIWEKNGCPPTIFIYSGRNVDEKNAMPKELHGSVKISATIYVLHEIKNKKFFIQNLVDLSTNTVLIFDGYPTCSGLDNIIIPVSEKSDCVITGHDAVITHILCLKPDEAEKIAKEASPKLQWENKVVGPPIPAPLFYKLQTVLVGRKG